MTKFPFLFAASMALLAGGQVLLTAPTPAVAQSLFSDDDDDDDDPPCMTSHTLRNFVASKGYGEVKLNAPNQPWHVHAELGGSAYNLVVDTCAPAIVSRQRLGSV